MPHYSYQDVLPYGADVTFNDVPVHDVIEADTGAGWLIRFRRDANNKLVVENGKILTERLMGRVRVFPRAGREMNQGPSEGEERVRNG